MDIKARFDHYNINVSNLEKSLEFYNTALGLKEIRRHDASDGSFTLVYLTDSITSMQLELTCLADHTQPYELGDNEVHLCLKVENDYDEIRAFHKKMGVVCYENHDMGLYFIEDPDGYWIEILPLKK